MLAIRTLGWIVILFFHRLEYLKNDMLFPTDEISLITHFKWGGIMFWNRNLSPLTAYLISFYPKMVPKMHYPYVYVSSTSHMFIPFSMPICLYKHLRSNLDPSIPKGWGKVGEIFRWIHEIRHPPRRCERDGGASAGSTLNLQVIVSWWFRNPAFTSWGW